MSAVLTVPEVAALLRVSTWTVQEMCRDGRLPRVAGLRRIRIPEAAVERLNDAWAEAKAALPEGWLGPSLYEHTGGFWRAYAVERSILRPTPVTADGPTPTAALLALAREAG